VIASKNGIDANSVVIENNLGDKKKGDQLEGGTIEKPTDRGRAGSLRTTRR
jgi:hypothetical protein